MTSNNREGPTVSRIRHIFHLVHGEEGVINILSVVPEGCFISNGCGLKVRVPLRDLDLDQSDNIV